MIEKITGIRIKGRCFKNDTDLLFYKNPTDRISVVYGKNGSGKSTISEGIASITQKDPLCDLSASFIDSNNQTVSLDSDSKVFVFNEKYIDENVKIDDDGLGTIVLIGGQVDLQSKIESQELRVKTISEEVEKISSECDNYQNKTNPYSPDYHYNRIVKMLKKDGGWAEIDSKIKGNKTNSKVTDDIVNEIVKLTVSETQNELQKRFDENKELLSKVSDSSNYYPNSVELVTYDTSFESKVLSLLALKIDKPLLSEREKLILEAVQNGFQSRVEDAKNEFSNDDTVICPYCYQPITDQYKHELIESINRVLNKDVDEHKTQLTSIRFPTVLIDVSVYDTLDSELVKSINHQLNVCQTLLLKYQEKIKQKTSNIYTPIIIESYNLTQKLEKLNSLLSALEEKRIEFNDAIKEKSKIKDKLIQINKSIAHIQIYQLYKDFVKQRNASIAASQKLKKKQEELVLEKAELKKLQDRKANIGLAIESINHSLDYVFLSRGRLSIELRNGKYYLKSNGNDVLPKKVSQGERNIIALCYFFTQILSNQEIGKLYQKETFVVIDDPVSSFDFENKIGINSFLRYQVNCIINGNSSSKVLFLSHDLETIFALRKAIDEICKATKGIANKEPTSSAVFELINLRLDDLILRHNEYGSLLKRVYHFANEDVTDESLVVGNEMRRVLEAFSSFTYQKTIDKVSLDQNVMKALGDRSLYFENLMYRLVLNGESHYEEQVYAIHDGNNFYKFISEEEKIKTAKSIICFMYILNQYHIMAYLQPVSGAIDTIKKWVKEIPDNDSFSIADKPNLRKIKLFSLKLAAGTGNDSFEGVPHKDYFTANSVCNFALEISGDSMEPNIPDGSVVLIKKQDTIDDGEVGAFYHNGKVYCKYINHIDGKAFLCSFNEEYDPIAVNDEDMLRVYGAVIEVVPPDNAQKDL